MFTRKAIIRILTICAKEQFVEVPADCLNLIEDILKDYTPRNGMTYEEVDFRTMSMLVLQGIVKVIA